VSAPQPVWGILVTHGLLGAELVRTAESILGTQTELEVVSNTGASPEALRQQLEGLVARRSPAFILVDLLGGSCGHACLLVGRSLPGVRVVSGVNLPMLLEFLCHRGRVSLAELEARLLSRGRDGIRSAGESREVGA
jgi:mannose/fructose-specific phosphotransferase system component IIA